MTVTFEEARTEEEKRLDAEVKERVQRGIDLLREKYGRDWVDKIDMETFDISNGSVCVLGQVYGGYMRGCNMLGISDSNSTYGFTINKLDVVRWEELQTEWMDRFRAMGLERDKEVVEVGASQA